MREASAGLGKRFSRKGRTTRTVFHRLDGVALNFLCSGSSALFLLIANFFPDYWCFSFFALIPLLFRVIRVNPRSAFQLGFLFGASFLAVRQADTFAGEPLSTLSAVTAGTFLFALFGWSAAWLKEKFGFNPLVVALLWVLFEWAAIKSGMFSDPLETHRLANSSALFHSWAVLFGLFVVSFVIVLVNSLLVFVIHQAITMAKARGQCKWETERIWDLSPIPGLSAQKIYWVPEGRGPPVCNCLFRFMILNAF